jgi:acetyltransferase-like isoleucine patch superfamily enzyme
MNSVILKGTRIGDNAVIGAGSVVRGEIPANTLAAGNPARIIRRLDES